MPINLNKGQKISLEKEAGGALTKIVMGLGWDVIQPRGFLGFKKAAPSIDLDASCVVFDENKRLLDAIWFRQLQSKDGSIRHTGDNRTGAGDGDDEQIIVELTKVQAAAKSLVFVVNSFTGQNFTQIQNAFCRICDGRTNKEIARYNLSSTGPHTAQVMAKIYRHNNEWKMHAIGENTSGQTFDQLMPAITPHL